LPVDRINPNGGSIALGHPFGATGARILSQGVKEPTAMPAGARSVVSVCADGGLGTVGIAAADLALGHQGCNRVSFGRSV
jgi:acetyl-CoA C-acetyltransferase